MNLSWPYEKHACTLGLHMRFYQIIWYTCRVATINMCVKGVNGLGGGYT